MGEVIALQKDVKEICRTARRLTYRRLTHKERTHVTAVEGDERLFLLFDTLQRDFLSTGWFVVPKESSSFETDALNTMHRFADEVAVMVAQLHERAGPLSSSPEDLNYRIPAR